MVAGEQKYQDIKRTASSTWNDEVCAFGQPAPKFLLFGFNNSFVVYKNLNLNLSSLKALYGNDVINYTRKELSRWTVRPTTSPR